ncbi:MAG: hypothetical protein Q7V05_06060 [Methanoregula sp.]|nr:hypothetical protein [Methanoregula sp.]
MLRIIFSSPIACGNGGLLPKCDSLPEGTTALSQGAGAVKGTALLSD